MTMPAEPASTPRIRAGALELQLEARRRATRQLKLAATFSFLLLGLLPFLLPLARATLPIEPVGDLLDYVFVLVCHRLPARTLDIAGVAMPVCSRCAGIFAGLGLGALVRWPIMSLKQARVALLLAGLVLLADVIAQDFGLHPLWHWSRLLTGGLIGYIATAALMAAIDREGRRKKRQPNPKSADDTL